MVVGLFSGGVSAAATLSIVAVVVYGARLTILGQMTTGTLTAFILYSLTGSNPLNILLIYCSPKWIRFGIVL